MSPEDMGMEKPMSDQEYAGSQAEHDDYLAAKELAERNEATAPAPTPWQPLTMTAETMQRLRAFVVTEAGRAALARGDAAASAPSRPLVDFWNQNADRHQANADALTQLLDSYAQQAEALARVTAENAEAKDAAMSIMLTLGPAIADAAIVGEKFGWTQVLGFVARAADEIARLTQERDDALSHGPDQCSWFPRMKAAEAKAARLGQEVEDWLHKPSTYVRELEDRIAALESAKQFAWVIEKYVNDQLMYWTGKPAFPWSMKHEDAIRFHRAQDGQTVLGWALDGNGRAVQHGWMSTPPVAGRP